MKPLLLLLGLSLAANVALYFTRPPASSQDSPAKNSSRFTATGSSTSAAASKTAAKSSDLATGPFAPFWEKLRAGDPSIVATLRAAGWPEEAIRALVIAQVNDLFRPRERAIRPDASKQEYWRQSGYNGLWTAEHRKAFRDLAREKQNLLKSILGPSYVNEDYIQDRRFAQLTPAQAESLTMIEQDYSILAAEVRGDNSGGNLVLLPEDREKLAFLQKEMAADLAKVLSPAELLDYQLKNSPTANNLRYSLTAFNPTETEFREIFALQKTLEDRFGPNMGMIGLSQRDSINKAQTEVDAQIKQILPPERYEDYVRAKDYEYRRLYQITDRLQLPPKTAVAAYEVKADIEKRMRAIKPTPGADTLTQMNEARATLAQEADKRLLEALGQRGLDAYKANGAYWLNNLKPIPASDVKR